MQMTPPLWQKVRGTKKPLDEVKKESENIGLKLNIQKTKIMASDPITLWQIDGETVETVADFIFLGSKITAHGDCSHEIKRHLLLVQRLKHLLAMRETWVRSLGQEVLLEKEMATHSSILAWRIPRMEEPGGPRFTGSQRVGHN